MSGDETSDGADDASTDEAAQTPVVVPGRRDVRATLDAPAAGADHLVVACPPHPQFGGTRHNPVLTAVSDALVERGVACLRFDYGEWDEGDGECRDARNAMRWGRERYDRVDLFGFSFGASMTLLAAAAADPEPAAASAVAPAATLYGTADWDAAAAVADVRCPLQIVTGNRDQTADWQPVVDAARERGDVELVELDADHHFVGQKPKVASTVVGFLCGRAGTDCG